MAKNGNGKISLSEIIGRKKINPKIARRRLRDAGIRKSADGWVFPASRRSEIAKIARG